MKPQITKLLFSLLAVFTAVSCSEDFLEVKPVGTFLEDNYYRTEAEAFSGLVSVYDILSKQSGGFENMITMMNAGSDDHFAGGGGAADGVGIQSFSNYTITQVTIPASFWNNNYQGIFRANILIKKLPDVPMSNEKKIRFAAECKFLRAFYYFDLVRLFKNVPLFVAPVSPNDIANVTQATPQAVYAQIEADLRAAFADLPTTIATDEKGRMSKGMAQALLGKVLLYQGKNSQAATELAVVNGNPGGTSIYGYRLLGNFSDLWVPANKFNSESIIEISHSSKSDSNFGNWGSGTDEGNTVNIMVGPRGYSRTGNSPAPDFVAGWSFNPITQNLYDALLLDPRFNATIADVKRLKQLNQANYAPGFQDTGYFLRKFMPRTSDVTTGGGEAALNFKQNTYALRLADSYLLEAEALGGTGARAQALLNAVRARVGLPSVNVSLAAIQAERRLELAGEGHRWFDIVRTNRAATLLSNRGFVAGKNEILPIPFNELQNTKLVQNPLYN